LKTVNKQKVVVSVMINKPNIKPLENREVKRGKKKIKEKNTICSLICIQTLYMPYSKFHNT